MKLPRRNFLHLAAGAAALPTVGGRKRIRAGQYGWLQALPLPAGPMSSHA
jgi:hypothetical protein